MTGGVVTDLLDGQISLPLTRLPASPPIPDPEDPTWWKAWANCRGVPSEVFYPGDVKRTGPETAALRALCVAEVHDGHAIGAVAARHGCTEREVRWWVTLAGKVDWQKRSARRTSERPDIEPAKAICRGCQVRVACLEWAILVNEQDGIWGGMTTEERRMEIRRRRRQVVA